MNSSRSFRTILLALTAGALGAIGCVITVGEIDCSECSADAQPDSQCNSAFNPNTGLCECDDGYEFANPNDPNDFDCDLSEGKPGTGDCGTDPNTGTNASGQCVCRNGTVWCSNDPDDLTCCNPVETDDPTEPTDPTVEPTETDPTETGPQTDTDDTDGTDTDPTGVDESTTGDTGPADLPPCDADTEGQTACTNNGGVDSVEGGEAYRCEAGDWIPVDMDAECAFNGDDFAYGCYINESDEVTYFCGLGPGTDCSDADDACDGDTVLQSCLFGKLTNVDCEELCTGKEAKTQYDFGECRADEGPGCCCFDEGEEGCA